MRNHIILNILFVFFIVGCGEKLEQLAPVSKELKKKVIILPFDNVGESDEALKNTVRGYNQELINSYQLLSAIERLRHYASDKETKKIHALIKGDRAEGKIMKSELARIEFIEVIRDKDKAKVKTSEEWKVVYLDIKTGNPISEKMKWSYEIVYNLLREEGRWVVGNLTPLGNSITEPINAESKDKEQHVN